MGALITVFEDYLTLLSLEATYPWLFCMPIAITPRNSQLWRSDVRLTNA